MNCNNMVVIILLTFLHAIINNVKVSAHSSSMMDYRPAIRIDQAIVKHRLGEFLCTKEMITDEGIVPIKSGRPRPGVIGPPPPPKYFNACRGIPYAEKALRWKDPVLKGLAYSEEQWDFTTSGPPCPHWAKRGIESIMMGEEDCLYADIFVPSTPVKKPVKILVWIHGGGFLANANRDMIPVPLMVTEDSVMVVTFNYRLGIFGYLSTGTRELAGNYGALDQIVMLKWIEKYGDLFGGDTKDVTIFGSSIGAVSVEYLMLSNLASTLFHKAIMESGSAYCERSLVPNPMDIAVKVGDAVGCHKYDRPVGNLVACLQNKTTFELMAGAKVLWTEWILPTVLAPVIDKHSRPGTRQFLPDYPENLPVLNRVPTVVGVTLDEGLTALAKLSKDYGPQDFGNVELIRREILPHYLNLIMRARKGCGNRTNFINHLAEETMAFYKEDFEKDPFLALIGILGDIWINSCHRKTIERLCEPPPASSSGETQTQAPYLPPPVFAYVFTHHDPKISPSYLGENINSLERRGLNHSILERGVAHSEEYLYLFLKEEGEAKMIHDRNRLMSQAMATLWSNFAHYGYFNFEGRPIVNQWPRWETVCPPSDRNIEDWDYPHYDLSLDKHGYFKNFRLKESKFWLRIHQDTFSP